MKTIILFLFASSFAVSASAQLITSKVCTIQTWQDSNEGNYKVFSDEGLLRFLPTNKRARASLEGGKSACYTGTCTLLNGKKVVMVDTVEVYDSNSSNDNINGCFDSLAADN